MTQGLSLQRQSSVPSLEQPSGRQRPAPSHSRARHRARAQTHVAANPCSLCRRLLRPSQCQLQVWHTLCPPQPHRMLSEFINCTPRCALSIQGGRYQQGRQQGIQGSVLRTCFRVAGNEAWQRAATALAQACAALSANAATSTAETVAKALLEPECASLHNAFQPQSTQPLPAAAVAAGAELLQLQAELCQKAFNPRHHVRTLRTLVTKTFLTPSGPALPVLLRLLSASSTQLMTDMQQQGSGGDSSAAADAALIWDAASQIIRFVSAAVSQPDTAAATDQVTHLQSQLQKLTETGGPLWRVMAVSMSKRTARVQFAGYQVLRSLYELQSAGQAGTLVSRSYDRCIRICTHA